MGNRISYLNGNFVPHDKALIHAEDRGFNFADSLYEVCRVYGGRPFHLDRHITRMQRGAGVISLDYGLTAEDLSDIVDYLVEVNHCPEASVYIQVTRGVAPRTHAFPEGEVRPTVFIMVSPVRQLALEERLRGVAAITHPDMRYRYCGVKTTALIPNVLAIQAAREAGAYEAILVRDGHVTEGGSTNVWMVENRTIHTFPMDNILPGVTRSVILDICGERGIAIREEPFSPERLSEASEAFLTGSILEIMPVVQLDGRPLGGGRAGPVTRELIDHFIGYVNRECGQYWAPESGS